MAPPLQRHHKNTHYKTQKFERVPDKKTYWINQENEQADKALGRFHFDTNVMVIFGKTANMGAMHDSYTEGFAKCIFKNTHEFCIGSLTLYINWFAGMLLKNVKHKQMF